ncbi:FAD/NAD(P)-binding domain-containing protein [Pleurostoma richardsiae]|uniref:FAD/NAD(P)-binding domain-containing protein n=1 Tax=Pleurostoma richardsiae TaxID=41990 RepID=A0AA38VP13_9PEZI|nr:FAD/NAD(P)-binding domain-containing protein [Pleurostoma richardsiae]
MAADMKVIIIGSGVTGCSLAHGLAKQGIQYEIFDKRGPETPQRDWGVTVHWAVEFLELYPEETVKRIKTARVVQRDDDTHQEFVRFYDGETGETIRDIPLGPAKRFSHGRIRGLLAESLPIQYNKELIAINELPEGVEAVFADGTKVQASVLVGCDGSRSATRKFLFEKKEDAEWSVMPGIILNNFWMQLEKEKAVALREQLGNFMDIAIHSNGSYFGLIPLDFANDKPPEEWKFQIFMSMPEPADLVPGEDSSARRVKIVKHFGKTFVAPFSQATEWFAEDTFISPDHYGTWETKKWDHRGGKVILAGDSAHSMTPHRAQGFNHSLQDVLNIITGLKKIRAGESNWVDFVDGYVNEVVCRGSEEVRMSLKQGYAVHNWANSKDLPILKVGTTPLHMEQSIVPLPAQTRAA